MAPRSAPPRRPTSAIGSVSGVVSPNLVGWTAELERLVSALAAPPAGVVVEGEAGIGKTRLIQELLARPSSAIGRSSSGVARVSASPSRSDRSSMRCGAWAGSCGAPPLSPVAGALAPLVPELAGVLPAPPVTPR
ncbi:MAG: ATP-binding protein [Acidimicrobiales bacterium]